ncbi:MAG: hypothetical protein WCN95_06035 [bacterium]
MSLQIRRKKDGTLASNYWYADYQVGGKRHIVPLGIEIAGRVPKSLKKAGSKKFERSRGAAQAEHDSLLEQSRKKGATLKILERIVDIRTEGQSRSLPVGNLADAWSTLSRKRKPSVSYLAYGRSTLGAFVTHLERNHKPWHGLGWAQPPRRNASDWVGRKASGLPLYSRMRQSPTTRRTARYHARSARPNP